MKKHLQSLLVVLFFAFSYPTILLAQIPDSCTFVESDSIITIDMESANLNGGFWVMENDATNFPGFHGPGYIQYIGGDATGTPGKSQLTYTFRVKQAGRHSFKMIAYRDDYHDNDVWVRFPQGGVVTMIGTDSTGTMGNDWFKAMIGARDRWYGFVKTQHLGTVWGEAVHDIYVDFPAPGVYTVEFSGRATGFRIDRFVLYYKKSTYFGMNDNNPESARENCAPYNMAGKLYVANPLPDQTVNGGNAWNLTIPANTFGNGTSINYSAYLSNMQPLPAWINFNQATGTFSANTTYDNGGKYTILVKAQDNGSVSVDAFILTVNGNNPPVMVTPLMDSIATVGEQFVYDFGSNFTDADGHTLNYTATSNGGSLPAWLTLNGTMLSGTPAAGDVKNDTIYVTVNDNNGGTITETFVLYVYNPSVQNTTAATARLDGVIYPNPAEGMMYIRVGANDKGSVILTNSLGEIIYTETGAELNNTVSIDLSSLNLKPGIYFVNVKSDNQKLQYNDILIKK